ncbi:MAG: sulfite exporter TauE/SafE family protein [Bauldia sp.]
MEISASSAELFGLAVVVVASGAVSGLLAGLFGIGGGAVIVPVLYQGLTFLGVDDAVRMHLSVGTSLGIIVPTSLRSFVAHRRHGAVNMELLRSWLIAVPLGAVAAALVAAVISGAALRGIFAVLALIFGVRLVFNRQSWRLGDVLPANPVRALVGFLIGFLSTLMGIGGGILNNTFMTLFGRPMHQAVATSAGVGALIALPGIVGYIWAGWGAAGLPPFSAGFVNLLGLALVVPVTVVVAPLGVRLAHVMSRRQLEIGFGLFLLLVSVRFALTLV